MDEYNQETITLEKEPISAYPSEEGPGVYFEAYHFLRPKDEFEFES